MHSYFNRKPQKAAEKSLICSSWSHDAANIRGKADLFIFSSASFRFPHISKIIPVLQQQTSHVFLWLLDLLSSSQVFSDDGRFAVLLLFIPASVFVSQLYIRDLRLFLLIHAGQLGGHQTCQQKADRADQTGSAGPQACKFSNFAYRPAISATLFILLMQKNALGVNKKTASPSKGWFMSLKTLYTDVKKESAVQSCACCVF